MNDVVSSTRRDPDDLARRVYDLLVIGGGVYGVFTAWDAAQRGLSVALIDKDNFGQATSANSLRIIHGGLRYLQHGDLRRMRRSIRERKAFLTTAPELVKPLPCLIPAYGYAARGVAALAAALWTHAGVGWDRNWRQAPEQRIPWGRVVSKRTCLKWFPGLPQAGLTGGILCYDAQVSDTERLVMAVVNAAVKAGAQAVDHMEVEALLETAGRVTGAVARDGFSGRRFKWAAKWVVNATGPWLDRVVGLTSSGPTSPPMIYSKAFNVLVRRQISPTHAVGVYSARRYRDRDAFIHKGSRLYFITPWRAHSLIGTAHLPVGGDPDDVHVTETELQDFLDEMNAAYPAAALRRDDVCHVYRGLLPVEAYQADGVQLTKQSHLRVHAQEGGPGGLLSLVGVKWTEARYTAEQTIDFVLRKLGRSAVPCRTATTRLDMPVYEMAKR